MTSASACSLSPRQQRDPAVITDERRSRTRGSVFRQRALVSASWVCLIFCLLTAHVHQVQSAAIKSLHPQPERTRSNRAHILHAWRGTAVPADELLEYFQVASHNLTKWQRALFGRAEKLHSKIMQGNNGMPIIASKRNQYFDLIETTTSCPPGTTLSYVGAAEGEDGGKWMCGVDELQSPCVVFSLGSNGNYRFEESILKETRCIVHTFDCTVKDTGIRKLNSRHFFHKICIGSAEKAASNPLFMSLPQAMASAGVRSVDVLKLDIEGFEYDVLATWGTSEETEGALDRSYLPGQVLLEVHVGGIYNGANVDPKDLSNLLWPGNNQGVTAPELALFFAHISELGYAVANLEKNPHCKHCCEYTLLKVR